MDYFKKKSKVEGSYIPGSELEQRSIAESDLRSNVYSELAEPDRASLELLGALLKKYKDTEVVADLDVTKLEDELKEPQREALRESHEFQNLQSNLTFKQQGEMIPKPKSFAYQENKELVMQVSCLRFLFKKLRKDNQKRAREYLEGRLLDKELRKSLKQLLAKREQLKETGPPDREKYSIESLEMAIAGMRQNLERVTGKNSLKKFIGRVNEKTQGFVVKNTELDSKADLIVKDFDQMREELLNIIVELN